MQLYSTNNKSVLVSLKEAVLHSLPADKGLYMPETIDPLPSSFFESLNSKSFHQIAFEVSRHFIGDYIPADQLRLITEEAINFPAPVKMFSDRIGTLELFHGPSLAFKDFGARFMSRLMSYFNQGEDKKLTILVATSGDTGGAVAAGFYDTPGIEVVILYPSGKVSDLQEKQLTTLGKNITALEIQGTFDDCQAMVKQAFLDEGLKKRYRLSSANSINIARLIPQTFYYFEAYKQVMDQGREVAFSVPSGNFGNITAGLLAKKMGLPVKQFIAATNVNDVVPEYLETGIFTPRPSIQTISNAMDVGSPSNFSRMMDLYDNSLNAISEDITGCAFTDDETRESMRELYSTYGYIADPHGAIGYLAAKDYISKNTEDICLFLETAHPGKFLPTVEETLGKEIELPQALDELYDKEKEAALLSNKYEDFYDYLISR